MINSVSVIIPTYNGAHKVANALRALELQSHKDFETIVVIDGSKDNTQTLLQDSHFDLNLKIIIQSNRGRAGARNRGGRDSHGNILVFLDDDMRPARDFIQQHLDHHLEYENSILTGAQLEQYPALTSDIQRYKATMARKWSAGISSSKIRLSESNLHLTAANCSLPRELFTGLGGFDERLTDLEDIDLACRAIIRGISVFYDPTTLAWHDDFISCRSYVIRRREYRLATEKLRTINPMAGSRFTHRINPLKKYFYFPFSQPLWVRWIDQGVFVKLLPRTIRYWFYSVVIWGLTIYYPKREV